MWSVLQSSVRDGGRLLSTARLLRAVGGSRARYHVSGSFIKTCSGAVSHGTQFRMRGPRTDYLELARKLEISPISFPKNGKLFLFNSNTLNTF